MDHIKNRMAIEFTSIRRASRNDREDYLEIFDQRLVHSDYISGEDVAHFEREFSDYLGVSSVVSCGNGSDALLIALKCLNLPKNAKVLVPDFTFLAAAEAVASLGLIPILVDIDKETLTITAETLERCWDKDVAAVIVVHLFGYAAPMDDIVALCKKNGAFLIEDCAQATGTKICYNNKWCHVGTIGDIGTTSFFPTKNLSAMGDGGAIFTSNHSLAQRAQMFKSHGALNKYTPVCIGQNSRLDTLQAAILRYRLKKIDIQIEKCQRVALKYDIAFAQLPMITIPQRSNDVFHSFHQYPIIIHNGSRDKLQAYLKEEGIPTMVYYPLPLSKTEAYKDYLLYESPVSLAIGTRILCLPIHAYLDESEVNSIITKIVQFYEE